MPNPKTITQRIKDLQGLRKHYRKLSKEWESENNFPTGSGENPWTRKVRETSIKIRTLKEIE